MVFLVEHTAICTAIIHKEQAKNSVNGKDWGGPWSMIEKMMETRLEICCILEVSFRSNGREKKVKLSKITIKYTKPDPQHLTKKTIEPLLGLLKGPPGLFRTGFLRRFVAALGTCALFGGPNRTPIIRPKSFQKGLFNLQTGLGAPFFGHSKELVVPFHALLSDTGEA